jgi:AcrR family transcriptional regulator
LSPQEIRETLVERTISVIANKGLDKVTTKAIVSETGINEAYIYRHFKDKEHLLSQTFEKLDYELVDKLIECLPVMYMEQLEYKMRCRLYFESIWKFLIDNSERCVAFVQYYYSPYFKKYSIKEHTLRYKPFINKIRNVFKDESDVWMILNYILNVMLDFAIKVHNEQMPNNDSYSEHVFRVIYMSVEQYFKNSKVKVS